MKKLPFFLVIMISVTFLFGGAKGVEAKSVVWTSSLGPELAYQALMGMGWYLGLRGASVSITYNAVMKNADTGDVIEVGTTIPTFTRLRFEIQPYQDTDISWNGVGHSDDTPYGTWRNGASAPIDPLLYYLGSVTDVQTVKIYVPLSVNPPDVFLESRSPNLKCNPQGICTVSTSGSVKAAVVFRGTYGKFYYKYLYTDISRQGFLWNYYHKVAMRACTSTPWGYSVLACSVGSSDYILNVPLQEIYFWLHATQNNQPPLDPTITGPATGTVNTVYTFGFDTLDPDDDLVRYGIDWDNDGGVDVLDPSSGYVVPYDVLDIYNPKFLWSIPGTYSFKARATDEQGGVSGWTTHTVTVTDPIVPAVAGPIPTCTPALATIQSYSCTPPSHCPSGTTFNTGRELWSCPLGGNVQKLCSGTCPVVALPSSTCNINNTCESSIGETPITCPSDCKLKYRQF